MSSGTHPVVAGWIVRPYLCISMFFRDAVEYIRVKYWKSKVAIQTRICGPCRISSLCLCRRQTCSVDLRFFMVLSFCSPFLVLSFGCL
ncbi:hypothetical protein KP509_05G072500 [Ceratopteris richardii]|uniref:Uncharacterized protein n=1 Tax=Ceratopteris richardii TaxID=49495 RepID=A0A8T2URR8_CERRI|nr:hypothetical protein KP509_05G072500 [Ceratopteris richardii]